MASTSLNDVMARLDEIVERARTEQSRLGFFAALYRIVTQEIEAGIRNGIFTHGEIVSRLALNFSDRYFTALERFRNHGDPSRCWRVAFDAASNEHLLIVQHLLLGMSAHINFDLGISTAEIAETQQGFADLKPDLELIYGILEKLLDEVEGRIGAVSPKFSLLDELGGRTDEALVAFSIKKARESALATSETLLHLPDFADRIYLSGLDGMVAGFGKSITNPILRLALAPIRIAESADVGAILDALRRPA